MQTTGYSFRQQVMPHAPGAVGPAAGQEADPNLRAEFFIAPAALAARPCQPRIETTRETPSASHNQFTGQIPRCFATKANFTSIPSRSRPRLFLGYPVQPSA